MKKIEEGECLDIPGALMLIGGVSQELSDYIFNEGGTVSLNGIRERVDIINEALRILAILDKEQCVGAGASAGASAGVDATADGDETVDETKLA